MSEPSQISSRRKYAQMGGPVAPGGTPPHDPGMEARVAVLEEIARSTKEVLIAIRAELAETRKEMRDGFRESRTDFRWLLTFTIGGFVALLGVMAHGFHWI